MEITNNRNHPPLIKLSLMHNYVLEIGAKRWEKRKYAQLPVHSYTDAFICLLFSMLLNNPPYEAFKTGGISQSNFENGR
jgi:hypothetical protein